VEQEIWEIASVFLMSTVKFVFGAVPMALAMGFSFFETVVVTSLGGFTGVLFFVFLSDTILKKYNEQKKKKAINAESQKPKKNFTRKNRLIVFIKRKFGVIGISIATPFLLSIPLGCFLAVRYFKNKQQIIAYMFASILFWSFSIASFKLFF